MKLSKPAICIVGPTASGKSDLAQRIACDLDGEVVSADSMQVYRGMDIGTAKLRPDLRLVPHYGIDLVNPGEPFSAALFQAYARRCFSEIDGRGKRIVVCGGTGFYIRAAIDAYDFPAGEQVGNEVRERYLAIAREQGARKLWEMLCEHDPESASLIPENDVKRVVRAFELLKDGTSYSAQKASLARIEQCVPATFVGLSVDIDVLRDRIDRRVDMMFEEGLVEEVESLIASGFRNGVTAPQAIGYKEVVKALDGDISLDEARESIKVATRRYAKRQRTWFRKDKRIRWIDATDADTERMTSEAIALVTT